MAEPAELEARLTSLENHLRTENPILLSAVRSFRKLDAISRRLGFLEAGESHATRIPWWPLVAILGTYSSGKSTFINDFLGQPVQPTGNQAVDDRFSVLCFGKEEEVRVLPGVALDADPRFPFYKMSRAIEEISAGEGSRIDAYLQLKACSSEVLRGKIFIDSPGFDADQQRTATLRVTDRIIDLSDLVLVFFDARHPEPGTMQDTLQHLVAETIHRTDSSKFLYVLNQMDHTARENNPEDIVGSWQRALAQKGLTAGRFYCIYSPGAAITIEDEALRTRYEQKRDVDLAEIHGRMRQVEVDRAYRVMGVLEHSARDIELRLVPRLLEMISEWRRRVRWLDGIAFGSLFLVVLVWTLWTGEWNGFQFTHPFWSALGSQPAWGYTVLAVGALVAGYVHHSFRRFVANRVLKEVGRELGGARDGEVMAALAAGFRKNTRPFRNVFAGRPSGWNQRTRQQLSQVITEANGYVQALNDRFANPGGTMDAPPPVAAPPADDPPAQPAA
ncbi:MAG: dynamin family protein [Deltaproteobacteria bacterium]|nr:dynamin family protein [Deltaproteobacteria bacterium]